MELLAVERVRRGGLRELRDVDRIRLVIAVAGTKRFCCSVGAGALAGCRTRSPWRPPAASGCRPSSPCDCHSWRETLLPIPGLYAHSSETKWGPSQCTLVVLTPRVCCTLSGVHEIGRFRNRGCTELGFGLACLGSQLLGLGFLAPISWYYKVYRTLVRSAGGGCGISPGATGGTLSVVLTV